MDDLKRLDELAWNSWCAGSFDDSSPFLQRAAARLAWAAICLICHGTGHAFHSQFTNFQIAPGDANAIGEMANQCAMAVDMTFTDTRDGRLMVAAAFSREMGNHT